MTKQLNNNNKRPFFLLGILFILVLLFWFGIRNSFIYAPSQSIQKAAPQKFYSKILKFEIYIPAGFKVEDKDISVNLMNSNGEISIGRNGTNFPTIEGYLNDLSDKNKVRFDSSDKVVTNGNQVIETIIKHPTSGDPDVKAYFIYKNDSVYQLSTSSPALYGDLDTIAQSFKYVP